jgi:hypothetical protein
MAQNNTLSIRLRSSPQLDPEQPSRLLNLDSGVRNIIYRFALVPEDTIVVEIADTSPMDPPLLKTCRQIRTEARGIFYQENKVTLAVRNLDIRNIVQWLDLSLAHHDMYANAQLALIVTPKLRSPWAFLRYQAFLYRAGRCMRPTAASSDARSLAKDYLNTIHRLQVVSLFSVAEKHLASDLNTFSVALEIHRRDFMAPHVNHIWLGSDFEPEFPPPLLLPPRSASSRVPPKLFPPMDWDQFQD